MNDRKIRLAYYLNGISILITRVSLSLKMLLLSFLLSPQLLQLITEIRVVNHIPPTVTYKMQIKYDTVKKQYLPLHQLKLDEQPKRYHSYLFPS